LEQKHGSLIQGLLATPTNGTSPYPPFVSFPGGIGELVTALVAQLNPVNICTGVGVTAVSRHATQYTLHLTNGQTETADVVILTTPAYRTAELLADLDPTLADLHAGIPHASSVTVTLIYQTADLPHPLNSYGYVIPRIENSDVLACTWTSSKWAGRVPEGYAMIRVYLGRYGRSDVLQFSDERLLGMALTELQKTMQITAVPALHRLYRWPNGMPQYTLGHLERLEQISSRLHEHPGLFLAGAAYRGVGIPDCIQSAETAVQATTEYLFCS
jgi:oxygen-dependent protoporphyrinogen oxidase